MLTDREVTRAKFRIRLMETAGWDDKRARKWALRLAVRDLEHGDDRHLCVECKHMTSKWECCAETPGVVVAELLQRCSSFEWERPA